MTIPDRKLAEAEFHDRLRETLDEQVWTLEADQLFEAEPMWANMKYYSIERKNRDYVTDWLRQHCKDRDVLDYCCGNGLDSVRIAKEMNPRSVVGIDISPKSVEHCEERARREGVAKRLTFVVMDAEKLEFPDNSFDVVHIYGVLHHLDLHAAFRELARVLRPGGRVIATEAMKHNPLIALYRRRTPHLRTEWEVEHILGRQEIAIARKYFNDVHPRLFNLFTLLAVPFRRTRAFSTLLGLLELLDSVVLRIPGVRWWAWMCVFTMTNPKKGGTDR